MCRIGILFCLIILILSGCKKVEYTEVQALKGFVQTHWGQFIIKGLYRMALT